jgi:hypothetical protein
VLQMWTSAVIIVALYSNRHICGLRVWHHQLHIYNITIYPFLGLLR